MTTPRPDGIPPLLRVLARIASLNVTVVCLALLGIYTVWGTLHLSAHGLYRAQQDVFYAWVSHVGPVPVPGMLPILVVFFFNLLGALLVHFALGWRFAGLILSHLGVLVLLAGGFHTWRTGQESFLSLVEGQTSNLSSHYRDWELSVWPADQAHEREVTALDEEAFPSGATLVWPDGGLRITVDRHFTHATGIMSRGASAPPPDPAYRNASGIIELETRPTPRQPERRLPGLLLTVAGAQGGTDRILLFGGESRPTVAAVDGQAWAFSLRRKRYPLPMAVTLLKFTEELYPNSTIPKAYRSDIAVEADGMERVVVVSMNRPFRYRGWTFYQASFAREGDAQISQFAVTLNYGRLIPYVATGMTFIGLCVHFLMRLVTYRARSGLGDA